MEPKSMLMERNGTGLARYFRTHPEIPPGTFGKSWFDSAIASKWRSDSSFPELRQAIDAIVEASKEDDGEWLLPLIGVFAQRLRKAAGHDHVLLQSTKELFDSIFRATTAFARKARVDSSDFQSDLPLLLVNELLKIYVLIGSDSMARNLIGTVEHPTFPPMDSFPTPLRVVYSYYVGRAAVLEGEPASAVKYLEFAYLALGPRRHDKNRRRILQYLVPSKVVLGWQPTKQKLAAIRKDTPVIALLIEAVARGDVNGFGKLLDANAIQFCKVGTFVMWSRCKMLALRNLLRRAVSIYRESCEASERNKIPIAYLLPAIAKWDDYEQGQDGELLDHAKTKIVSLIAAGLIKGYLAFERAIIVVSPNDAFPKTSSALDSA